MPKNPLKNFARRKSSGNVLDLQPESTTAPPASAGSSFRVLERPDKTTAAAAGAGVRRTSGVRPLSGFPLNKTKGKSTDDLLSTANRSVNTAEQRPHTIYEVLNRGRGSGGTALSGSSGYFDNSSSSARYSSSSTLPSSVEAEYEADQDELFPRKSAVSPSNRSSAVSAAIPEPPSFSARAGRAMSFGLRSKQNASPAAVQTAQMPDVPENSLIRDRATTMSSYASTAVPPRLENNIAASDFGNDFGNMFEGLGGGRKEAVLAPPPTLGNFGRSESEPSLAPPSRAAFTPSPDPALEIRQRPANLNNTNRYSWSSRTSNDGLMSPGLASDTASPPLQAPSGFARFRPGYQPVPDRYGSPAHDTAPRAVSSNSSGSSEGEAIQPVMPSYAAPTSPPSRAAPVPPPARFAPSVSHDDLSSTGSIGDSQTTTPRANHLRPHNADDLMFETSPAGPPSRALHPALAQATARPQPKGYSPSKRMTKIEFEQQRAATSPAESEESDLSDEGGYDDDDEAERQAELARLRRKQEANLAIYRQQMKKVSGGNPQELPSQIQRPGLDRTSLSSPGLTQSMAGVSLGAEPDEDDEVPLGILQAHGFPNKNRPPVRLSSAPPTPGDRPASVMGDVGGNLPPFARNLPADPYFGASLVNPIQRESLAFGSGGSVYGGAAPAVQPPMQPPGGLVGVIAGEERARAARRANPNPAAGFSQMPLPQNMQYQMPPMMPRSNSMMSTVAPPMGMGGFMPPMMTPQEMSNQQQMIQMMQMQQQMMQQMMALQQGQMTGQMPPMPQQLPNGMPRPMSMNQNMNPQQQQWNGNMPAQRSSTMTNLKPPGYAGSVYDYSLGPPPQGYTPSIAPSERSNVGMPSRYRPVTMDGANSRTGTMTSESGLAAFAKKNASTGSLLNPGTQSPPKSTIKIIEKPKGMPKAQKPRTAEDEDDEEGWLALRKKREERKRRNTKSALNQQQEKNLEELYQSFE